MLPEVVVSIIWLGVLAYGLFGGSDYGAGIWDLLAGGGPDGARRRRRIEDSIGPVWEANHVWLIFVLVYLWTGFPTAFAQVATTLWIPLLLTGAGIVFRGAAFVFRKSSTTYGEARWYGVLFATSSVVTPFFLGTIAGSVASGRVPAEGVGDHWTSWINPTSILGGALAVGTTAWLAATLLAADSARAGDPEMRRWFGIRSVLLGVALGALALGGIWVLRADAPLLADHLQGRALPFVLLSAVCGVSAILLVRERRASIARIPAMGAVASVLLGWGVGQYPYLLEGRLEITDGAAPDSTLWALVIAFVLAGLLVVPCLVWMLVLTERGQLTSRGPREGSSSALAASLSAPPPDAPPAPGPG